MGASRCEGRGVLIFIFEEEGVMMGLVHPHGIYAATSNEYLEFRLASAMVMKQHGIRMIGGVFKEPDISLLNASALKRLLRQVKNTRSW